MTDPALLRIGNLDRDELVALLQRAVGEGRLTPAEMAERSGRVAEARTYADLDALVADLPVPPPSRVMAARRRAETRPGWDPAQPLVLGGGAGSERRTGRWEIPPYVRLSSGFGSIRLNCLAAVCLAPVVDVEVTPGAGSIRIVVPDGWGVDTDRLAKGLGSMRNEVRRDPEPGQPRLVLRGVMGVGSVKVRPATRGERRRLQRQGLDVGRPALGTATPDTDMPNADDLR